MIPKRIKRKELSRLTKSARVSGIIVSISLLTGCSLVPDWANPVELYDNIAEKISSMGGTDPKAPASKIKKQKNGKFPNLGSVPKRPAVLTEEQRERLSNSLKADRENARYSRAKILRQDNAAMRPPPTSFAIKPLPPLPSKARALATEPALPPPSSSASVPTLSREAGARNSALGPRGAKIQASPNLQTVRPLIKRARSEARSVARVGNQVFGAPPADILAAHGRVAAPPLGSRRSLGAALPVEASAGTVRFTAGSAALTQSSKSVLRRIVKAFGKRGGTLRVEGHASSRTRDMDLVKHHMVNLDVSRRRVNAVAKELLRLGVPSQSVFAIALSDSRPIYDEIMPSREAGNQRVEIYFVK